MIGAGSLIITHSEGWACTKEAYANIHFDVQPNREVKKTMVVDFKNLFNCKGNPKGVIKGIFKFDTGNKSAFTAQLVGSSRLIIQGEVNDNFDVIIKEIHEWDKLVINN